MTFLNPLALIGLLAAGIPILLHIFNLRKLQTIEFSTLSFLKELQKTKIRRLKLRQLLLLFLRILFVILVVLAFSRPTLKGSLPGTLAEQAKTTAVIIIDDSQSMTASDAQGIMIQQAINAAHNVLNLLKDGDEIFLQRLSAIPLSGSTEQPQPLRNFSVVRTSLNEIKPTFIHRRIEDAIRYSARLLSTSQNINKEIYVISDFQSGSFESRPPQVKVQEKLFDPTTHMFFVPLGSNILQNIAIEGINIINTIFEVNKPFTVKIKLVNHGATDVRNHVVSIYQNRERVAQKGFTLKSGQSIETEFILKAKHSGIIDGMVELEDDDLEFDNKRYFTISIPEEIPVLIIGEPSDLKYIRLALSTRLSDSSTTFRITESTWDRFSTSMLQRVDVLVLSNPPALSPNLATVLKSFLQGGGGILFFPGNRTTGNSFQTISSVLGVAQSIPQNQSPSPTSASFIEFDRVDFRHPLFAGMFDDPKLEVGSKQSIRQGVVESPQIKTSLHFQPNSSSKVIISQTDGFPFFLEEQIGYGHAILVSVAANTEWSDFPLKGLFTPLIHRSVTYLAQSPTTERSLLIGEERRSHLRIPTPLKLSISKPGGMDILVNVRQLTNEREFNFTETDIPGIYSIHTNSMVLEKFAVNIDPAESEIRPIDEKRRETVLKRLGINIGSVHIIEQPQDIQRIVADSRYGTELWKHLFLAALCIALIEMFVARDSKKSLSSWTAQIEK